MSDANLARLYPAPMLGDLEKSGLLPTELRARPITPAEKAATGTPQGTDGYVLPYFNMQGLPIPFYRVKLFQPEGSRAPRYLQPENSQNHIYFPPRLKDLLPTAKYIMLTEGEKKAAKAVAEGIPCVAVSGVESWRNRTLTLPADAKVGQHSDKRLVVRLPAGSEGHIASDTVATGFNELIDFLTEKKIPIIIAYDSDLANPAQPLKTEVRRAAALLGYELRFRGLSMANIRHLVLSGVPSIPGSGKVGLDDLLVADGGFEHLSLLIQQCLASRSAFPRHPNPKEFVNTKLQRANISRKEAQQLGMAVLADLDARGQRLRATDEGNLYYFGADTKKLTKISFNLDMGFGETPFGRKLYQDYNLTNADKNVMSWFAAQFSGEEPISNVEPRRVSHMEGEVYYHQLDDGHMVRVKADAIDVLDNGADGVLFEGDHVEGIDVTEFQAALRNLKVVQGHEREQPNWWYEVLKEARLPECAGDKQRRLLSFLYYISPWFYRWRGTQLPVEITTGEAGAGKSTLYELRLDIITGVSKLRNPPDDMRDWSTQLGNTGALHVTDNVQLVDNALRQKLSDEICRLVTEPNPAIERRKLYSDNTIVRVPVTCVFAITAIKQPFQNVDIIQRAIITTLDKGEDADLRYDADWKGHQLQNRGGRVMWLAHHMLFIQKLLAYAGATWQTRYRAKYRLINVEQLLIIAAKILSNGTDDGSWIPGYLEQARDVRVSEADWTLEGLKAWAEYIRESFPKTYPTLKYKAGEIAEWCAAQEDFKDCQLLNNPRSLGRHMSAQKHLIATVAGISPLSGPGNSTMYGVKTV